MKQIIYNFIGSLSFENDFEFHHLENPNVFYDIEDILKEVGFFSYVRNDDFPLCVDHIVEYQTIFIPDTKRVITLDAEYIHEGMALEEINKILDLPVFENINKFNELWENFRYSVYSDDFYFTLWDTGEKEYLNNSWWVSLSRTIELVNTVLNSIDEQQQQLYYDFEGTNDTLCVLLSKRMVSLMISLGLMSPQSH
jgi:hypothetical protein